MNEVPTIYLVDDDRDVLHSTTDALESCGLEVLAFRSAERLLRAVQADRVGCVIADLHMPGMDGRELQQQLSTTAPALTIVIVTGQIDVATAVEIMKQGAIAVLEKPFELDSLLAAISAAEAKSRERFARIRRVREISQRLGTLADDERVVAQGMIAGTPIKALARHLRVSMRTIDRRRQSILAKMNANSIGELACMYSEVSLDKTAGEIVLANHPVIEILSARNELPAPTSRDSLSSRHGMMPVQ